METRAELGLEEALNILAKFTHIHAPTILFSPRTMNSICSFTIVDRHTHFTLRSCLVGKFFLVLGTVALLFILDNCCPTMD